MVLLLIPGFWLDATSWDRVVPLLERAGHEVRALTLPGLRSRDEPRGHITLADQVDFVVSRVLDALGIENRLYRRWSEPET
jgi:pimeloyl-ACP methyl ester carboxylesterase